MLCHPAREGARRRALALCASSILILTAAAGAAAQIGGLDSDPSQAIGNRGNARNSIQGFVTLPNGARISQRAKVRIFSATGASLFTMTDDNGAFIFSRLAGGMYTVTIDAGKEFDPVTENVDIFDPGPRSGRGSSQTIHIQLRYRASAASGERPGTVDAALAGVPGEAVKKYEKGLKAAQQGDAKKAVEFLKAAVELHPEFALAHGALGVQYLMLNRIDEAGDSLRAALRLAPDNFSALLNYGILHFYKKDYPKAAEHLSAALKRRDSSASAHYYLGRTLIKLKRHAEAERELRRAVEIGGPEVHEAYRYLGGLYMEAGDDARAVESLEKYLKQEPQPKDAETVRQIVAQLRTQAPAGKK